MPVPGGRDIVPAVNELLNLPFAFKVATQDYHPVDHISFNAIHEPPNNIPYESTVTMINPSNPSETRQTTIWPVHCVQGTKGAQIISEIDTSHFEFIVEKGKDKRVEMYSGFADAFGNKSDVSASLDLAALLSSRGITHVYIVGLTGDCCVKCTAIDAKKEGLEVYVVEEGTRSVDSGEKGWAAAKQELELAGVQVVSINGSQVGRVKGLV